ncbi:MAG: efflux RND transporter permease subunit [Candidatus Aminicenantes bacterium]|nr:efflux RND transporter permease subunit [Candidatus Aminicenantes bacterium]
MRIADISIKQPVFITMVIAMIVVLGLVSYTRLGVDLMPDVTLPIVAVSTPYPGVGPEEVEQQVTKPIEDVLSSINGLDKLSSTSSEGVSVIIAQFKLEKDAQQVASECRDKISTIRGTLPRDILEPIIDKFDASAAPVLSYGIVSRSGRLNTVDLRLLIDDEIKPIIERVDGVGHVSVVGGLEREIKVKVDNDKLTLFNLSLAQVGQAIRSENLNLPAGRITQQNYDFLVRTKAEFREVDELNRVIVANPAGNPIYLRDVATVSDSTKTRQTISRVNGVENVTVIVLKRSGTNTVKVAEGVRTAMVRISQAYPDLDIKISTDESVFIKESRDDVLRSLIEGAILAGLVVLLSFGDLRNTLITIAGLPVCIIGTYAVMAALGFTINVITLLALSLSIGLLIDDAIVVRENIFRHMEKLGKHPMQAASEGTAEVGLAVMATTLTLVSVFLPVGFATGIAGKFFKQFGITIAAAVLISMFEAFTFAPMLSAYFFKESRKNGKVSLSSKLMASVTSVYDSLGRGYRPILKWAVGHRKSVMVITLAIFALSGWLFTLVGIGGTPHGNRPEFNIKVQVASGSSLESTERTVRKIEDILRGEPEVKDVFSVIGTTDGASDEATVNVKMNIQGKTDEYQDRLRPKLAVIPGAKLTFQESMSMGGSAAQSFAQLPIQINIKSTNLESLTTAAEMVRTSLAQIPQLVDLNTDYKPPKPEIQIQIDRERASQLGVNTLQVASALRSLVDGDIVSRFRQGEKLFDIRVLAADDTRQDLDRLSRVYIPTMRGGMITLDQVAKFKVVNGPTQIKRKDRVRQVTVVSNVLKGAALNQITREAQGRLSNLVLPKDVTYDFGGQVETNAEMFQTLTLSLALAVIFVYMILASQFGSFLQPFALMLALPLSIIGAVLGLLVANKLFDMVAFIGLIMLMGLVTKNSILLIDYTNVLRRRGMEKTQAILEAGATRLRPILMTSLAMILGMIPVAFGIGASSNFRAGIGFTIIGGLISSTILTLVIVPVFYVSLDNFEGRFKKKKAA